VTVPAGQASWWLPGPRHLALARALFDFVCSSLFFFWAGAAHAFWCRSATISRWPLALFFSILSSVLFACRASARLSLRVGPVRPCLPCAELPCRLLLLLLVVLLRGCLCAWGLCVPVCRALSWRVGCCFSCLSWFCTVVSARGTCASLSAVR